MGYFESVSPQYHIYIYSQWGKSNNKDMCAVCTLSHVHMCTISKCKMTLKICILFACNVITLQIIGYFTKWNFQFANMHAYRSLRCRGMYVRIKGDKNIIIAQYLFFKQWWTERSGLVNRLVRIGIKPNCIRFNIFTQNHIVNHTEWI